MTRVLNAYLVRSVGLNAVKDAVEGKAKFTDPEYVAAAQMFADMAQKGYFVEGMTTIDPATASAMLESGDAAIKYDGSWYTDRLNQPDNMAGPEGIGFFNVPVVTGVEAGGTLDDYSMNCGNILMVSADAYDEQLQHWMKFVFTRIGDFAMQNNGSFKGYKINEYPEMTAYTQIVADALRTAKGSFLWFEAKMDSESSQIAQNNIAMLYSGEMTAEEYMNQLQESIERNR